MIPPKALWGKESGQLSHGKGDGVFVDIIALRGVLLGD